MASVQAPVTTWSIDAVHSTVEYGVKHLALSTFRGKFTKLEGSIQLDESDPENSSVNASIDATSFDIANERFYGHIAGGDFLDTANHPKITFQSTGVQKVNDTNWKVSGNLALKGVTKPVVLDAVYLGQATHPFSKKTVAGFEASTTIDRRDFGITWNVPMDNDLFYVGEQVTISLVIEAVKQD